MEHFQEHFVENVQDNFVETVQGNVVENVQDYFVDTFQENVVNNIVEHFVENFQEHFEGQFRISRTNFRIFRFRGTKIRISRKNNVVTFISSTNPNFEENVEEKNNLCIHVVVTSMLQCGFWKFGAQCT